MCSTCTPCQPAKTETPEPIQMGKEYQTRDGRPARILAVDVKNEYPVIAAMTDPDGMETARAYTIEGYYTSGGGGSRHDLIPVDPLAKFRNLAIDAPIWVRSSNGVTWAPRHFAGIAGDMVHFWASGATSHTRGHTLYAEARVSEVRTTKPE